MRKKRIIACLLTAALVSGIFGWRQPVFTYAAGEESAAETTEAPSEEVLEGESTESKPEEGTETENPGGNTETTEAEETENPGEGTETTETENPGEGTETTGTENPGEGTETTETENPDEETEVTDPEDGTEADESIVEAEDLLESDKLESGEVALTPEVFPDERLREVVSAQDLDANGTLNEEELKLTTALICPGSGITNLTGIEKLTFLNYLDFSNSGVTDYTPISALPNLIALKLDGNNAGSLDVRGAKNLQTLSCKNSGLTSLEVENLPALRELRVEGNALTGLNLAGLTALERLTVQGNQLISLDASPCTNLRVLQADGNQLTGLNVGGLSALVQLDCQNNQLTELQVNGLTSLEQLNVSGNRLAVLDIAGLEALYSVYAGNNQLTGEWNTGRTKIASLEGNQISGLTEGSAELSYLNIRGNALSTLTFESALKTLYCSDNQLSALGMSNYDRLETVYCENNKLPYMETGQALDLSLSPQAVSLDRVKQGAQQATDLGAIMTTPELLERTEVVQQGMVTSVKDGIVSFSGAESSMQYRYKTSTATNATMTVDVSLTEVDRTEEWNGSWDSGNSGGNTEPPKEESSVKPDKNSGMSKAKQSDKEDGKKETEIPVVEWRVAEDGSKVWKPQEIWDENNNKYLLITESVSEETQKELLQKLESDQEIQKVWADMNRHSWIEIHLGDTETEEMVQPSADISFRLSYPEGTTGEMEFVLVHMEGGSKPVILTEGKDFVKEDDGFLITVDNFSPFVVGWREAEAEETGTAQKEEALEEKPVQTPEKENAKSSGSSLLFPILLVAAAAVGGTLIYFKKKK